jgi:hypothetical protein
MTAAAWLIRNTVAPRIDRGAMLYVSHVAYYLRRLIIHIAFWVPATRGASARH